MTKKSGSSSSAKKIQGLGSATGKSCKSDYAIIKEGGWNNTHHFIHSYGIKPHESGSYQEAKAILNELRKSDGGNGAHSTKK